MLSKVISNSNVYWREQREFFAFSSNSPTLIFLVNYNKKFVSSDAISRIGKIMWRSITMVTKYSVYFADLWEFYEPQKSATKQVNLEFQANDSFDEFVIKL